MPVLVETPEFSDAYSLNTHFEADVPGKWEDIGAFPNRLSPEFATHRPHLQWEVLMSAQSPGEVIFESNPADNFGIGFGFEYYNPAFVKFGYASLQVGNPTQSNLSPWRNPNDPADIDGNGLSNEEDLVLIETVLGIRPMPQPVPMDREVNVDPASIPSDTLLAWVAMAANSNGKVDLDNSDFPTDAAPFLDVDGNRIADSGDAAIVREKVLQIPEPFPVVRSPFDDSYELNLSVVNKRTGQQVSGESEVFVGDLLQVELTVVNIPTEVGKQVFTWGVLSPDSHYQLTNEHVEVIEAGTFELKFDPQLEDLRLATIVLGVTPEALVSRIKQLIEPHTLRISAKLSNRPEAADHSYSWPQFDRDFTAREISQIVPRPDTILSFNVDISHGLLKNVDPAANARAVLVSPTSRGDLEFHDDGSFKYSSRKVPYSLYDNLASGDQFSYVIVTPFGTSEIRQVEIEPVVLTLVDLRLIAVDAEGNEINSLVVGEEFFLEAHAFSNNLLRVVPPWLGPVNRHPLQFEYQWDHGQVQAIADPIATDLYNGERSRLDTIDDELVLITEVVKPRFEPTSEGIKAYFNHFSLTLRPSQDALLFRQKMVATQPVQLNPAITSLQFGAEDMSPESVNVETATLEITAGNNFVAEFDISQDGRITASDALLVINELNENRESEIETLRVVQSATFIRTDVNRDGRVTASDALRIINWLNDKSNQPTLEAEGEFNGRADQVFGDVQFLDDLDDFSRTKKRSAIRNLS